MNCSAMSTTLTVNWQGKPYEVEVADLNSFTVGDLKAALSKKTNVLPKRCVAIVNICEAIHYITLHNGSLKLMGVGTPRTCLDEAALGSLKLKKKLMMMGSPETVIALNEPSEEEKKALQGTVEDDFDFMDEQEAIDGALPFYMQPLNQDKLRERCKKYSFEKNLLNPPRPGKKLLVLDIDYTLFDHHSNCEQVWMQYVYCDLALLINWLSRSQWNWQGRTSIHFLRQHMCTMI